MLLLYITIGDSDQSLKHIATLINVYAPTTKRLASQINELDLFYTQLSDITNNFKNISSAMFFVIGDFNAKVGKRTDEPFLDKFLRIRRNNSGEMLINYCEMNNLFIANSAFDHPARHITTWSRTYIDKITKKPTNSFSQIDYIITNRNHKHCITDARSYAGTKVFSDHRLVVARLEVNWSSLYKKVTQKQNSTKRFNTELLTNNDQSKKEYQESLTRNHELTPASDERWDRLKGIITSTAEEIIGYQSKQQKKNKTLTPKFKNCVIKKANYKFTIKIQQTKHNTVILNINSTLYP